MHQTIKNTLSLFFANALIATTAAAQQAIVLPVEEEIQEQSSWCWAASATAVINYYFPSIVQQCEVAEYTRTVVPPRALVDYGDVDCCVSADYGCNDSGYLFFADGSIEDIFNSWGIDTNPTDRVEEPISLEQTDFEISHGRPFVFRWGWYTGGGHFLVMHGIEGDLVHYMDPWWGEGYHIALYDWVVDDGIHLMTSALTTNSPDGGGGGGRR
jgi:hypothetical protein